MSKPEKKTAEQYKTELAEAKTRLMELHKKKIRASIEEKENKEKSNIDGWTEEREKLNAKQIEIGAKIEDLNNQIKIEREKQREELEKRYAENDRHNKQREEQRLQQTNEIERKHDEKHLVYAKLQEYDAALRKAYNQTLLARNKDEEKAAWENYYALQEQRTTSLERLEQQPIDHDNWEIESLDRDDNPTDLEEGEFYTLPEAAKEIADFIKSQDWFGTIEQVIEPSAGAGAFSKLFPKCKAYDIEPRGEDIIQADFFTLTIDPNPITLTVGNPPFGKQGSLALKFMAKAATYSEYIAFILPRSFKKISLQNRVPLTHSLLHERDLAKDIFVFNSESRSVPCVFQVWHRCPREKASLPQESKWFTWTTKEDADLAIRRVGGLAGRAVAPQGTCERSHYYIRCDDVEGVRACFNAIDWLGVSDLTTGSKSISKGEIVRLFDDNNGLKINNPDDLEEFD